MASKSVIRPIRVWLPLRLKGYLCFTGHQWRRPWWPLQVLRESMSPSGTDARHQLSSRFMGLSNKSRRCQCCSGKWQKTLRRGRRGEGVGDGVGSSRRLISFETRGDKKWKIKGGKNPLYSTSVTIITRALLLIAACFGSQIQVLIFNQLKILFFPISLKFINLAPFFVSANIPKIAKIKPNKQKTKTKILKDSRHPAFHTNLLPCFWIVLR